MSISHIPAASAQSLVSARVRLSYQPNFLTLGIAEREQFVNGPSFGGQLHPHHMPLQY